MVVEWLKYILNFMWQAVILACNLTEKDLGCADVNDLGLQTGADLWFDARSELQYHLLPIFTINNLLLTGPD